jgi:HK97 family phage prohead protease
MEPIRRSLPSEVSRPEGAGRTLRGLIPYDAPAVVTDTVKGKVTTFREVIRPGAFARALGGAREVISTFNHDVGRLLGRTGSGTLRLTDTPEGLRYEVDLPECAADVAELLTRGDLRGSSFVAFPVKPGGEKWTAPAERGGLALRELVDLECVELGPVVMPAYPASDAAVRSGDPAPHHVGGALSAALVRLMERAEGRN